MKKSGDNITTGKMDLPGLNQAKEVQDQLERELALTRQRLDISLSAGNLAWWEMDVETGGVEFNENKVRMLGYTMKEFADAHYTAFTNLLHPDDFEPAMQAMRDHLAGTKNLYEVEYRIKCKDGSYKWFYDRGSVTDRDEQGRPLKVKGIVFDYTEKKRAEEALLQSEHKLRILNSKKDKFFSILAHDLKSPFNSLLGFSNILHEQFEQLTDEDKKDFIRRIHDVSTNTYSLLQELLEWARSESGNIDYRPDLFDIYPLVQKVISQVMEMAKNKQITLVSGIKPGTMVFADQHMVHTIIRNLVTNAIKYTPRDGAIYLSVSLQEKMLELSVEDTGVGISQENMGKLFSIDQKYKTNGTENELGTGLGLILCKEFAIKNRGDISVESEEGKGSVFRVNLPRVQND